jgi:hypothetical protein
MLPVSTEAVVKYVEHLYGDFDGRIPAIYGLESVEELRRLVHEIDRLSRKRTLQIDPTDAMRLADFLEAVCEYRAERFNARRAKKEQESHEQEKHSQREGSEG